MWRDIQRRVQFYGLPTPKVPAPYPVKEFDRANHVGIIMNHQGRYLEYFEHTYRLWFLDGLEAGSKENLQATLSTMGVDFDEVTRAVSTDAINDEYRGNTNAAQGSGIFGTPSFSVGTEIFWGDDRLEDEIRFSTAQ